MRIQKLLYAAHTFAFLCCTLSSIAQGTASSTNGISTSMPPMAHQDVGGAYWHIDGNFESILNIKNVLETTQLTVTPVLWMADGTEYDLRPITLDKAESIGISITHAIADAPPAIAAHASQFGSAGIRYSWNWRDAAVAHVDTTDEVDSLAFVTHASAALSSADLTASQPNQNIVEGLWWLQTKDVVPFLTFVNTNSKATLAHIEISDAGGETSGSLDVPIPAGKSEMVQLSSLLSGLSKPSNEGGVKVTYFGSPGSLVVEGGVQDFAAGYSAPLPLISIESRHMRNLVSPDTVTLASVGVQMGKPESRMQFPQDTFFVPYAFVKNLSEASIRVKLDISYMSAGPQKKELASLLIGGKRALNLNLEELIKQSHLDGYSGDANFIFSFDGQAGDLLFATGSTAKDNTYVFSVDPMIVVPETGKIFCDWQASGATDTMLSFWNSGASEEDAELVIFFSGGKYRLPIHLASNETQTLNLASLINTRLPDADGNIIPRSAVKGSARLTNPLGRRTSMDIKANAAIFNVQTATCRVPCPVCDDVTAVSISSDGPSVVVGGSIPFTTTVRMKNGETFNGTSTTTWSSSASNIASIVPGGTATGVNYGSSTITGRYSDTGVPTWQPGSLCSYPGTPNCPMFISAPTAPISVQPPSVGCTATIRGSITICTATGGGVTFSNWQFADGSNVVVSANGSSAKTWTGIAVRSGIVSVTATLLSGGSQIISGPLTVIARSGWAFGPHTPTQVPTTTLCTGPQPPVTPVPGSLTGASAFSPQRRIRHSALGADLTKDIPTSVAILPIPVRLLGL